LAQDLTPHPQSPLAATSAETSHLGFSPLRQYVVPAQGKLPMKLTGDVSKHKERWMLPFLAQGNENNIAKGNSGFISRHWVN